jgi:hypothetical protein
MSALASKTIPIAFSQYEPLPCSSIPPVVLSDLGLLGIIVSHIGEVLLASYAVGVVSIFPRRKRIIRQ